MRHACLSGAEAAHSPRREPHGPRPRTRQRDRVRVPATAARWSFLFVSDVWSNSLTSRPPLVEPSGIQGKSGRKCMLTGKKANNGWTVSFSHIRNKKLQGVNLQYKRVYWPEKQRYVRLRISTSAMKSINKIGLEAMAKRAGLDLESLAYSDASAERREWRSSQQATRINVLLLIMASACKVPTIRLITRVTQIVQSQYKRRAH